MLKRERKQKIGDFTKKRDKKLNPLEKEIKTKRDNVVRLDKLIFSTKKLG